MPPNHRCIVKESDLQAWASCPHGSGVGPRASNPTSAPQDKGLQMGMWLQGRGQGSSQEGAPERPLSALSTPLCSMDTWSHVPHSIWELPDEHAGACVAPGGPGPRRVGRVHLPQDWEPHPREVRVPWVAQHPCATSTSSPRCWETALLLLEEEGNP